MAVTGRCRSAGRLGFSAVSPAPTALWTGPGYFPRGRRPNNSPHSVWVWRMSVRQVGQCRPSSGGTNSASSCTYGSVIGLPHRSHGATSGAGVPTRAASWPTAPSPQPTRARVCAVPSLRRAGRGVPSPGPARPSGRPGCPGRRSLTCRDRLRRGVDRDASSPLHLQRDVLVVRVEGVTGEKDPGGGLPCASVLVPEVGVPRVDVQLLLEVADPVGLVHDLAVTGDDGAVQAVGRVTCPCSACPVGLRRRVETPPRAPFQRVRRPGFSRHVSRVGQPIPRRR